ncbi:MAG: hypothetical protein L3K04_07755 [Thermoplasmata archaeon]|nr:hypothetical protein [Thermoplasmata archaeon]MCI4341786.1 hypothetical protein [Thermoplasmata archaeon]
MALVGQCRRCGNPASLRCTVCGRLLCRSCLDSEERICPECTEARRHQKGIPSVKHPPSRLG